MEVTARPRSEWDLPPAPYDGEVGAAAQVLVEQGHTKAAALLLDVQSVEMDTYYRDAAELAAACLVVHPYLVSRFDEETCEQIRWALDLACFREDFQIVHLGAFPAPASSGWREKLQEELASGPRNQATVAKLARNFPRADSMAFRTPEELKVYEALKDEQESRPSDDTFTIIPNCAARVPHRTWEPDFLIIFRGRCAAIEVDGGSHRGKYLTDKSRDDILMDSGVAFVRRIDAQDVSNDDELKEAIKRILARLERP